MMKRSSGVVSLCCYVSLCCFLAAGPGARAQITVDGSRDAGYGSAVSVQATQTQFGDNFSELNAAYARTTADTLFLLLAGNLENNFNKLNVFVDVDGTAGGQNSILGGSNPPNDGWAGAYDGFTFDPGYAPDYLFVMRNGNAGGDRFDIDFARIGGGATDFDNYTDVFGGALEGAADTGAGANLGFAFEIGFDNSNVAGVAGGTGAADQGAALAVTTGIELGIPLAALGSPSDPNAIRISAMVNGSNHDFLSNQFLGPLLPDQGNLGGDGLGNFTGDVGAIALVNFPGDQFFTVPEPDVAALILLGTLVISLNRRPRRPRRRP